MVYHGLAGHFYLRGISHVLKVRILADIEDRVRLEMERENISRDEALHVLKKDDQERRQWSLRLFGVDTWDPSLYDLVIHIHKITVGDAVDLICRTAGPEKFRTTAESQRAMDDLVLASRVKAQLVVRCPSVKVRAIDRVVYVGTNAGPTVAEQMAVDLRVLAEQVPGVKDVRIDVSPTAAYFSD